MIIVHYCNINEFKNSRWERFIDWVPQNISDEILKYQSNDDKLVHLMARLLLLNLLLAKGYPSDILSLLKKDRHNRPYLPINEDFNTSHSGNMVLIGLSDNRIGVDIEQTVSIDWENILYFFHPAERENIITSEDPLLAFYQTWVKKEAMLKAVGAGISDEGLNWVNINRDKPAFRDFEGHFYEVQLTTGYIGYVCSDQPDQTVIKKKISPCYLEEHLKSHQIQIGI